MERITSTRNPRIRRAAALAHARERRLGGRHLVEGPNAVAEALAAGLVEEVFVLDGAHDLRIPAGTRVTAVSEAVLTRLADATSPQGVVAVARTPQAEITGVVGDGLLVILDTVADPGNAGTIIRTADAVGARGVVLTRGSVDPFGPKAVRAAAGSTYHLPIVTGVELARLVIACRQARQRVVGLDGAASDSIESWDERTGPLALVLGNEAQGLGAESRELVDELLAIPLHGRAESLNVAAAASIALFVAARATRRTAPDGSGRPAPWHPGPDEA